MKVNDSNEVTSRASDILQHPLVLQCAWRKLSDLYRLPWTRDPKEWAHWCVDPWRKMVQVASKLADGRYLPKPFYYLPYPKKDGKIRQYFRPSIEDEFAFLLVGVVLTPLLETRMWPFSFGGRWYRGIVRRPPMADDDPFEPWRFHTLPFSLSDRRLFQSYRRSYGLFRRVAHWTALRMLNIKRESHDSGGGPSVHPEDYPIELLPYIKVGKDRRTFRTATKGDGGKHIWTARLDLASAYPCVRRDTLAVRLKALLEEPLKEAHRRVVGAVLDPPNSNSDLRPLEAFGGNGPWRILEEDNGLPLRRELASLWMRMLKNVEYEDRHATDWSSVNDQWKPSNLMNRPSEHAGQLRNNDGIPTGLAVSSVWFNVYLHGLDTAMAHLIGLTGDEDEINGAFLRFVDDMVVIAPEKVRLEELVDGIAAWLKGKPDRASKEGIQPEKWAAANNLVISHDKVMPEWIKLRLRKENADILDIDSADTLDIDSIEVNSSKRAEDSNQYEGRVDEDNLGPFVTTMVEAFSEIGRPTLHELFGSEAGRRLVDLHRFVRMQINDDEVRLDTRMAFAGRRIATAPLPFPEETRGDEGPDHRIEAAVEEISRSVRLAIMKAPWKFQLWEAVNRLGIRQLASNVSKGIEWLLSMYSLLSDKGLLSTEPWDHCDKSRIDPRQRLFLSFLRAAALIGAMTVHRDLARATRNHHRDGHSGWVPTHWAFPLMTMDQAVAALSQFERHVDRLVNEIYGTSEPSGLSWWEFEALKELKFSLRGPASVSRGISTDEADRLAARWIRCQQTPEVVARIIRQRFSASPADAARHAYRLGVFDLLSNKVMRRCAKALARQDGTNEFKEASSSVQDFLMIREYDFCRRTVSFR